MLSASEERPPGLKPTMTRETYAALKGRSSTAKHKFTSCSEACWRPKMILRIQELPP